MFSGLLEALVLFRLTTTSRKANVFVAVLQLREELAWMGLGTGAVL